MSLHPSSQEDQLAEDYASLLGTVSRIDQAVRDGAWDGVRDELDQLISAAEDMWATLSETDDDAEDGDRYQAPVTIAADPATVRRLIALYAEPHSVGRLLHPAPSDGRAPAGDDPGRTLLDGEFLDEELPSTAS
ncbi:hypothetical protein ACH427_23460 [Streptomyces sp. NPDC020379]|uniref:hypothetical protein n=1 Tax=Streptomyces sp. NPDC020379 TaxID=3365071 RepID=UPI0037BE06BF